MPIAFKEWAVTVRALAEGEQLLTLRKGGIREPDKHFKLDYERFFLYPTFDHQRADLVRESHRPELSRALEEGVWADGEPVLFPLCRALGLIHNATPALVERIAHYQAESGATQKQTLTRLRQEQGVTWGVKRLRQVTAFVAQALEGHRAEAQAEQVQRWLQQAQVSPGKHRPVLSVGLVPSTPIKEDRLTTSGSFRMTAASAC